MSYQIMLFRNQNALICNVMPMEPYEVGMSHQATKTQMTELYELCQREGRTMYIQIPMELDLHPRFIPDLFPRHQKRIEIGVMIYKAPPRSDLGKKVTSRRVWLRREQSF